jgi:NAD(P)-dependent dehydrogenase (short-subunit alcohol dehydrogenase family)
MPERTVALVTGGAGGIGLACARALGRTHCVVLTDLAQTGLDRAVADLVADGVDVADTLALDLTKPDAAASAVSTARAAGTLQAVVNAAGLSPSLAAGATILEVNVAGAEHLLLALERDLEPGLVAVLIASIAAHLVPPSPVDAVLANPLAPGALESALQMLGGSSAGAYSYSKRANLLSAQRRAAGWAQCGARIVTISPGLVATGMGRREVQEPTAAQMLAATPLGWGQPEDIGATTAFLCSEGARYITGTDVKVDGGICGVLGATAVS